MEAIQQNLCTVIVPLAKRNKTRKQMILDEPNCPVCFEALTCDTLIKPARCHNICSGCSSLCTKCLLCRKDWSHKQSKKRCQYSNCQVMTKRKCMGIKIMGRKINCNNNVCSRCNGACNKCTNIIFNEFRKLVLQ
jgi:hypothetical protein